MYSTVDFGPGENVSYAFGIQRLVSQHGPLVCSEFYTGWIDTWGSPHSKTPTESIVETLEEVLGMNASINFYMFHGGTNFGYSNGNNE